MTATSAAPRVLRNFVNGEYVEAQTDATTDLVSPVTAQVVATAPVSTAADVDAAYASASKAFEEWGQTTPSERQQALLKFADAIEKRADEFVKLEAENTGKPLRPHRLAKRSRRWSTSCGSSPAPPGCSRGARPGST